MILVGEINPLPERRMTLAKDLVQQSGTRVGERVFLQLDERGAGGSDATSASDVNPQRLPYRAMTASAVR